MIVQLTRFVLFTAGALGGFRVSQLIDWTDQIGFQQSFVIFIFIILGCSIGYLIGGIVGRELTSLYDRIERSLETYSTADIVLSAVGLVTGLVVALMLSYPLRMLRPQWVSFLSIVLLYGLLCYAGVRVALIKRIEVNHALGKLNAGAGGDLPGSSDVALPKILDTSAVIDGRFAELRRTGFLEGRLRVPGFVLAELQTLADSADDERRARGRRGLDLLATARSGTMSVDVFDADYPDVPDVDGKLLRLAKDGGGAIVTVDFNLTKVARVQGLPVLNLNELALALKPSHLPGEVLRVTIAKEGKEPGQGVGYLPDGTMVVVAGGHDHVGSDVDAEVTSVLQTSAGRMVFSKVRPS
ncbi:MAG: TRAM domain-containing protein [Coriobacteriia bacterium]